jgi:hypothetical protein
MSNETKQTAVEWLLDRIEDVDLSEKLWENVKQQAKEMEKEQIVNTWSEATAPQHEIGLSDASYVIAQIKKAEQYYNETYGGNK